MSFFSLFPFFSRDGNYAKNLLDAHLWICGFSSMQKRFAKRNFYQSVFSRVILQETKTPGCGVSVRTRLIQSDFLVEFFTLTAQIKTKGTSGLVFFAIMALISLAFDWIAPAQVTTHAEMYFFFFLYRADPVPRAHVTSLRRALSSWRKQFQKTTIVCWSIGSFLTRKT